MPSTSLWSVTLTGALLPQIGAEAAWSRVAVLLGRDAASLRERLPVTFKPVDEAQARRQCEDLRACGVEALALADDDRPHLWIHLGGNTHGPVSPAYARHALALGVWSADTLACLHGRRQWQALGVLLRAPEAPVSGADSVPPPLPAPTGAMPGGVVQGVLPTHCEMPTLHAGFWMRVVAYFIDMLVMVIPVGIIGAIFGFAAAVQGVDSDTIGTLSRLLGLLLAWPYFALCESSSWQATVGKRAMGLRVTDDQGRRIGFGRATGRYFGRILSGITLLIGYMLAGWTARKQALHDMLAGCCVVRAQGLKTWQAEGVTASTPATPSARGGMPGWAIALVVAGIGLFVLAILAAIAVPAYQQYQVRSQVTQGMTLGDQAKVAVATYIDRENDMPTDNAAAGLERPADIHGRYVSAVSVNQGYVVLTYGGPSADMNLRDRHLVLTPRLTQHALIWHCSSPDIKDRYLPMRCR